MQSLTSSYYTPRPSSVKYTFPISGNLGFLIDIPHKAPEPSPWYFGENPVVPRRELIMRPDPEYFPVGNIIPYIADNIPLVDINHPSYHFNRLQHTFYI